MWDKGDGEMGCMDGDGLEKYQQGMTANPRAYYRSVIMGVAEKIRGEDSSGRAQWKRFGKTGMDTAAADMQDGNRRDVGRRKWQNGLEERQRTAKILTGNDYQPKGVSSLQ